MDEKKLKFQKSLFDVFKGFFLTKDKILHV